MEVVRVADVALTEDEQAWLLNLILNLGVRVTVVEKHLPGLLEASFILRDAIDRLGLILEASQRPEEGPTAASEPPPAVNHPPPSSKAEKSPW